MKRSILYPLLSCWIFINSASISPQTPEALGPGRVRTSVERMGIDRLRAVREDRLRYARERHEVGLKTGFTDYRAVMHAHAGDSAHTGGTREELLAAAKKAGVRIVMLSDHARPERDFINDSWRGVKEGVLFIPGAESQGFLVYPTASIKGREAKTREDYIRLVKQGGGNIFLSHVEERLDWPAQELDGLEIYNHHTDVKAEAQFSLWLRGAFTDAKRLSDLVRSLAEYPEEVFGAQQDYLGSIIAKWDQEAARHRLAGIAANDCHHNQVFTITAIDESTVELAYIASAPVKTRITVNQVEGVAGLTKGRKPGEVIARLDFDPYERSLRYVTTHILAGRLQEASVRDALKRARAYVAHDWLCDPTGFAFTAEDAAGSRVAVMGDNAALASVKKIRAETPVAATLKLFNNGGLIKTVIGDRLEFEPVAPGVYRVEAWLILDGEQRPWIYSNHIYLR